MSDSAVETAAPVAPAEMPTPAPSATAAPAPAAQPGASAPKVEMTPEQLKGRLDEERKKAAEKAQSEFLKALGVTNVDEARAKIEAQKKLEEEKLSELQRRDKAIEELKPKAERATTLESVVKRQSDAALASLTEEQRAAVARIAGDDPVRVFDTIEALRPTWSVAAPAAPATPAPPAAPKPLPAPATTAPPPVAPSPANPAQVPANPLATWERLKSEAPHIAAQFYLLNQAAIVAAQKAQSA